MDQKSFFRHIAICAWIAGVAPLARAQTQPPAPPQSGAVASQPGVNAPLPIINSSPPAAAQQPGQSTALTPEEAKQSSAGNVAELQQMIRGSDLSELRTTYNGSYGASLLFYGKEMTYYVALFQQKNFWRVIKTSDSTRADMIYKDFVRQTQQLSDVEIRRMQLDAQKAFYERMIAVTQDRANRLQADLDIARTQQNIVNGQQASARAEATALNQQKSAAQEQLRAAQQQVRELQRQLEIGLPTR